MAGAGLAALVLPIGAVSRTLPPGISENDFQLRVIQWVTYNGWLAYHTHDSRRSVEGFPDLCCVPDARLRPDLAGQGAVFLELKSEKGRVSAAQEKWVAALHAAGVEVRIIRPADWPWVVERFGRRRAV